MTSQQPQATQRKVSSCYWCQMDYFVDQSDANNKDKYHSRECELKDENTEG